MLPATEPCVEFANVDKTFGPGRLSIPRRPTGRHVVLRDVSFQLHAGQIMVLRGANGSGKTTLLKIIAGLVTPDAGTIILSPPRRTVTLGFSSGEERSLYWRLTAYHNLELFGALQGLSPRDTEAEANRALESVGLQTEATTPVRELSAGQRQRLLVARALMGDPDLLLLDEPGARLDDDSLALVWEALTRAARRGAAIVVATHHAADEQRANVIAHLKDGHMRCESVRPPCAIVPSIAKAARIPRITGIPRLGIVLLSLFKRDWRNARSYPFSIVFQLVVSILGSAGLFFLSRFVGSGSVDLQKYGGSYFAFAVLGTVVLTLQLTPIASYSRTIREGQQLGTLEALLSTPTPIVVLLIGSSLWTLTLALVDALILLGASIVLGLRLHGFGIPLGLLVVVLLLVAGAGIGFAEAGVALALKRSSILNTVVAYTSSLCGGVLYPLRVLPLALQGVAAILPVAHAANGLRFALVAGDTIAAGHEVIALALLAILYCGLGLPVLLFALGQSKRSGALGQY